MKDNTEIFSKVPVPKAIISLIIPTIIGQLVTVIYNMADTFFIGQLNDPRQVAAATIVLPAFIFLTGIANLFGIGGSSLIARRLGTGEKEKAMHTASFSIWTALSVTLVYSLVILLFNKSILRLLGADAETLSYSFDYLFWIVVIGGIPTVLNTLLSLLIRAEGYSRQASIGVALGGVLNIALDPFFIWVLELELKGAAIATMLSNVVAAIYFIIFLKHKKETTVICLSPKKYCIKHSIPKDVVLIGLSSFIIIMMAIVSNIILNNFIASYSTVAIAGIGIAKKVDFLIIAIANGLTQGVLPLFAFNFASGDRKRMLICIKTTFLYSMIISVSGTLLLFFGAANVTGLFIDDADTIAYGKIFLRILSLSGPFLCINYLVVTIFQATGEKTRSLVLSMFRKGIIDIPFMLFFHINENVIGIGWSTPIADFISFTMAILFFVPYWKKLKEKNTKS